MAGERARGELGGRTVGDQASLWAPRWVGAILLLRGLVQPLTEQIALRNLDRIGEGMRLADAPGQAEAEDPLLGVAARAIEPSLTPLG
jgi:hypothetical protein